MYILYVQGAEIVSEKSFLFSCIFTRCFCNFFTRFNGGGRFINPGMYKGNLKEQVLLLCISGKIGQTLSHDPLRCDIKLENADA